jgi:multidrug resistance efflux pump
MSSEDQNQDRAVEPAALEAAVEKSSKKRGAGGVLRSPLVILLILAVLGGGGYFGYQYWVNLESKVYIENSSISAPLITVSPAVPGVLNAIYVKPGDTVYTGEHLFNVGDHITTALTPGIVTTTQNTPGQMASSASSIVQMYDPQSLRVVGQVQEDQGLMDIHVGQKVTFTVDAFGSRQFQGVVESVGNIPDQSSIVFSISDKRQEKQFDVKVAFDINAYPELLNGMSAKMWIIK